MEKKLEIIHFVITGGTIDSYYSIKKDTAVPNTNSAIPGFIKSLDLKAEFTEVCMKDSREFTHEDLENILKAIEESPYKKIIITHGTYTMPDTGRYLKANLKRKDQTILLTGSMIPMKGFSPSDSTFNLGYAMAKIQNLPPGIFVCMNARVFSPDEIMKVISEGKFASIFG